MLNRGKIITQVKRLVLRGSLRADCGLCSAGALVRQAKAQTTLAAASSHDPHFVVSSFKKG